MFCPRSDTCRSTATESPTEIMSCPDEGIRLKVTACAGIVSMAVVIAATLNFIGYVFIILLIFN